MHSHTTDMCQVFWSAHSQPKIISGCYHSQAGQAASHAAKGLLHTLSHQFCCYTQLLQIEQLSQHSDIYYQIRLY